MGRDEIKGLLRQAKAKLPPSETELIKKIDEALGREKVCQSNAQGNN